MSAKLLCLLCTWLLAYMAIAQYQPATLYQQITDIHNSTATSQQKIQQLKNLSDNYQQKNWPQDSVYALILHRTGLYLSQEKAYESAIDYTTKAFVINSSGRKNCSDSYSAKNLRNIGVFYKSLFNFPMALQYLQQSVAIARQYPERKTELLENYNNICDIQNAQGNFEERKNTALLALGETNYFPVYEASCNYTVADAAIALHQTNIAKLYLARASACYKNLKDTQNLLLCQQLYAEIAIQEGQKNTALQLLTEAANQYHKTNAGVEYQASALLGLALLYRDQMQDFNNARLYLQKTIALYKPGNYTAPNYISACNNLGHVYALQKQWLQALYWCQKSFGQQVQLYANSNVLVNPSVQQIKILPNTDLIFITAHNKAELLMQLYRSNHQPAYLQAASATFLLADSVLTYMRNQQSGEDSRLYWRNKSRNFYQQALELCYLKNDPALAFYFMEKSRAVLLNDHLKEVGAGKYLPDNALQMERSLKSTVMEKQIHLSQVAMEDKNYYPAQKEVLEAQQSLTVFLHQLEKKYPAYYQYKYADEVPAVADLQQYLKQHKQQWIQYFLSDTLLFVLQADGKQLKLYRQVVTNLENTLPEFVKKCSDKEYQNQHYNSLLQTAAAIYDTLLRQLHPHPGRLIISPDNTFIPFDVLCSDVKTKRLMVEDYAISYAYSARFLPKQQPHGQAATGNFLGMAPVNFPNITQLVPLQQSAVALQKLKQYYANGNLLTGGNATRRVLLSQLHSYRVVNLYTHARGNNGDTSEPELFLADSAILLSELQMLQQPATQLIVLSACQTNSGKLANGEGVYSLARGFAMAGIPATVATLWKADEETTYGITENFHKNLSLGMSKDIALQQAKLSWMKAANREKQLPFYWADLTLTGNPEPLSLNIEKATNYWLIAGIILAGIGIITTVSIRRKQKRYRVNA